MFQQQYYWMGLLAIVVGTGVITPSFADKIPVKAEKSEVVQSDSADVSPEEILKIDDEAEKELSAQSKKITSDRVEENVATITAEGDFIVPTFLLPSVEQNASATKTQTVLEEKEVNTVRNLPVVKITQTELIPVREQMAVERRLTGKTTKTSKLYQEALARSKGVTAASSLKKNAQNVVSDEDDKVAKKKKLLLPLKPLPKPVPMEEEIAGTAPLYKTFTSETADRVLNMSQDGDDAPLLMPMDIKVTFYPNSSEFSGQMVKWIKVFSLRARNDPRYIVDIRLSSKNQAIQQKRLMVIRQILKNNGLSQHQIVVDYVDRPENSLILRMVKKEENVETEKVQLQNGQIKERKTINW